MTADKKVSELLGDKPITEQTDIIRHVLHEVGGYDARTASTRAHLYTFIAQFAGADDIGGVQTAVRKLEYIYPFTSVPTLLLRAEMHRGVLFRVQHPPRDNEERLLEMYL